MPPKPKTPTGRLHLREGKDGTLYWEAKWYANRRQVKRRVGPAWVNVRANGSHVDSRANKPDGYLREGEAHAAMRDVIEQWQVEQSSAKRERAAREAQPATFAEVAERWYARAQRRNRKPATLRDYRQALDAYLLPEREPEPGAKRKPAPRLNIERAPFATLPIAQVTPREVRAWFDALPHGRTKEKLLMVVRSIFRYAMAEDLCDNNPALTVDRDEITYDGTYDWFTVEEVERLVAAAGSDQDAALYATAALTGLRRGELLALRWRDVDVAKAKVVVRGNVSFGELVTPKSGRSREVPLVPMLADRLLSLREREHFTGPNDYVFPGVAGGYMDPSALRRRYAKALKAAKLRHLPFHSLRHHFGSQAVQVATLVQVKTWMGHSDLKTTARYLHARSTVDDADLLARGFQSSEREREFAAVVPAAADDR